MKYLSCTTLLFCIFCFNICSAQNDFWNSSEAYLGQALPQDETPKIFASELLKDRGVALDRLAFSANGKEFYYCWAEKWFDKESAKVKYFRYEDGKWNGPAVLTEKIYAPTFSMDDQTLYFLGEKGEIWQSKREGSGWTKPAIFLKKSYGLYDFMPTLSGRYYVASNTNGGKIEDWSSYDFCQLIINKADTTIKSLGAPLNTDGFNGDFFIAKDESFIIVSANETADFESELHISFRKADNTWTDPKSLGPLINNGTAHRWGQYVSPDNKYLFYTQGTSEKDCHIYWLRFDKLMEKLRPSDL